MREFSSWSFFFVQFEVVGSGGGRGGGGTNISQHPEDAYWLLFRLSQRTPHCKTRGTRKVFRFGGRSERRENFSAPLHTFQNLVAERRVRGTIVLSSFRNTTCVEHNLSYRQADPEVEWSLCVPLRPEVFSFTIFLLIFLPSLYPCWRCLGSGAASSSHAHTPQNPKKFHSCISAKQKECFFSGWWGKKQTFFQFLMMNGVSAPSMKMHRRRWIRVSDDISTSCYFALVGGRSIKDWITTIEAVKWVGK